MLALVVYILPVVNAFIFDAATQIHQTAPVVRTSCGLVMGTYHGNGYSYKSIPYAMPPTGSRRWQPPEPLRHVDGTCWSGVYNATTFISRCVQWGDNGIADILGTEDCLHLNVWSPDVNPAAGLPVMVWVHGGGLEFGSSHGENYSPTEELARDTNVVYVSMNYRLQAFGFLALDILTKNSKTNSSGNYGFMDQILALQWVQDNIVNFGGNPTKVTLFGQSGGASSVAAILASPLARGLFSKAWTLSGSPIYTTSLAQASRDNLSFLNNSGCSDITCLQGLSVAQVTQAVEWDSFPNWNQADQYILPTRTDHDGALAILDGYVLPESPEDAWLHGTANDVPLLIGDIMTGATCGAGDALSSGTPDLTFGFCEGTMAQELDDVPPGNGTWSDYEKYVTEYLGTFNDDLVKMALHLYPVGETNPRYQLACMVSDLRVGCGNDVMALYATSGRSSVYRYVAVAMPSSAIDGYVYAFHNWDMYAFFGSVKNLIDRPTTADYMFEANIRQEVMSFVHDAQPHTATWKPFPDNVALLSDTTSVVSGYHSYQCSFWMMQGMYPYSWAN